MTRSKWIDDIIQERKRQVNKWGVQRHADGTGDIIDAKRADIMRRARDIADNGGGDVTWRMILLEEVYEAFAEFDVDKLRSELVQVAAVAAAWIEDIDSRPERLLQGLCGDREDHEPHAYESVGFGLMWCHANQKRQSPFASDRVRSQHTEE